MSLHPWLRTSCPPPARAASSHRLPSPLAASRRLPSPLAAAWLRRAVLVATPLCLAAACAEAAVDAGPAGEGVEVGSAARALVPDVPLRGDRGCAYGTFGCNRCVPDVPARFNQASGSSDYRHRFYFNDDGASENGPTPDAFHVNDHIQSVARIPGLGQENWVALTRNARDVGDAAFYLAQYTQIGSHGDAWKWAYRRTTSNPTARWYDYYRIPGFNHAGGAQALGPLLFVATDCDEGHSCSAAIHAYDVRTPSAAAPVNVLTIDGSRGELDPGGGPALSSRAASVGAVRLESGHYLLFVRGREADESGWFFISETPGLGPATRWALLDTWRKSAAPGLEWHPWENINLVTDCNDGRIYGLMMGTLDNKSYLYRVESSTIGPGQFELGFTHVDARGLNTTDVLTSTRFGAGVHIAPNGNLVSYVTDRQPESEIEEFRYHGSHGD